MGALVLVVVYIGAMITLTATVRRDAREWYIARGVHPELVIVGPVPGQPLKRDVIVRADGVYHFASSDVAREPRFAVSHPKRPMNDGAIARRALATHPGLERWIRLPAFEVTPAEGGGHDVAIRDVRYDRMGASLGRVNVRLPPARSGDVR